jgi:hypothetical protein
MKTIMYQEITCKLQPIINWIKFKFQEETSEVLHVYGAEPWALGYIWNSWKVVKCGAAEARTRSVGQFLWKMNKQNGG